MKGQRSKISNRGVHPARPRHELPQNSNAANRATAGKMNSSGRTAVFEPGLWTPMSLLLGASEDQSLGRRDADLAQALHYGNLPTARACGMVGNSGAPTGEARVREAAAPANAPPAARRNAPARPAARCRTTPAIAEPTVCPMLDADFWQPRFLPGLAGGERDPEADPFARPRSYR